MCYYYYYSETLQFVFCLLYLYISDFIYKNLSVIKIVTSIKIMDHYAIRSTKNYHVILKG